jgi:hypothetical protein
MKTFREWVKKRIDEDGTFTNPMDIQQAVGNALNPTPGGNLNPNLIATQFVQKMSKPVLQAIANNPVMQKLQAAQTLANKKATPNQVVAPTTMANPVTPGGLNYN